MGLRERKKQRQRAAILDAASDLARERGFEHVRVADLTEQLEISEATFFNYFASRAALLDAWLEDALANAFAKPEDDPRRLRASLRTRVRSLAEAARRSEGIERAAWRGARLQRVVARAAERSGVAAELAAALEAGDARRDVEPARLAERLVGAVAIAIATALSEAGDEREEALAVDAAASAADLVLDGARRRHERVRISAASGSTRPRTPGSSAAQRNR